MAYIRLKSPQMARFSSYMGTVKFENGMSVDHVSQAEARLLGSITAVEFVDEAGNPLGNAGYGQENVDIRSKPAPDVRMPKPLTDKPDMSVEKPVPDVKVAPKPPEADKIAETQKALDTEIESLEKDVAAADVSADDVDSKTYTRADLESIADLEGISGLRKIGDPMGVKSNSIDQMITKILGRQG